MQAERPSGMRPEQWDQIHGERCAESDKKRRPRLRRKAVSLVVSAFHDNGARQVRRLLHTELTPLTMGHIPELIQHDMGLRYENSFPTAS